MNVYELKIHTKGLSLDIVSPEDYPFDRHIECESDTLEKCLSNFTNNGVLVDYRGKQIYIPSKKITYIEVNFLEKIQRNVEVF